MTQTVEFARPYRLDELGEAPRTVTVAADATERAALATRFDLVAIDRLEATASLAAGGTTVLAEGVVSAAVVQRCVVSGDPVPATIREPFTLKFVARPAGAGEAGAEIELSEADCDVVDYGGSAIDLGEAVAETLALALDPFPRSPAADGALKAAGVLQEGETGPFAALKSLLKDR